MVNPKTKCFFLGHKIDDKFTDSGYYVCERCGMHEYWNNKNVVIDLFGKDSKESKSRGFYQYPFYGTFASFIYSKIEKVKSILHQHKGKNPFIGNNTNNEQDLPF